jgi:REP element-mobilizing transposase RayT
MPIRYKNRYRVPSARLVGWDYRQAGAYAVTICTRHRHGCLSEIVDGQVVLSPIGEIVAQEWLRIPRLRPTVTLDTWIIMPDHLHGILMLASPPVSAAQDLLALVLDPARMAQPRERLLLRFFRAEAPDPNVKRKLLPQRAPLGCEA